MNLIENNVSSYAANAAGYETHCSSQEITLMNISEIVMSIEAVCSNTWMDHVEADQLTEGCDEW